MRSCEKHRHSFWGITDGGDGKLTADAHQWCLACFEMSFTNSVHSARVEGIPMANETDRPNRGRAIHGQGSMRLYCSAVLAEALPRPWWRHNQHRSSTSKSITRPQRADPDASLTRSGLRLPPVSIDCDQACEDLGVSRRTLHICLCLYQYLVEDRGGAESRRPRQPRVSQS